jgi:hypothetical protein
MPFTRRERNSIVNGRDEGKPQLPLYDESLGWGLLGYCENPRNCPHLELNHIQNQSDGGPDTPRNSLTLPKCIHVGVCPSNKILYRYALTDRQGFIDNFGAKDGEG